MISPNEMLFIQTATEGATEKKLDFQTPLILQKSALTKTNFTSK